MNVANLTIGKGKYAVIPWKEYERFRKWETQSKRKAGSLADEDQADVKECLRRLSDPKEKRIPWSQVKKQAGLV